MIKITLSDEAKKRVKAEYLTLSALSFLTDLSKNVENFIQNPTKKYANKIKSFVINDELKGFCTNFSKKENFGRILLADAKELDNIKNEYSLSAENIGFLHNFFEAKYTTLQTSHAHWFGEITQTKVCPYCNINFVYTYDKNKVTFQLDHFYPKDKYPYLALSFYNLVPCCGSCNQQKSTKNIDIHPHIEALNYEIKVKFKSKEALKEAVKKKKYIPKNKEAQTKAYLEAKKSQSEKAKETQQKLLEEIISDTFGINFFYGNLDSFSLEFEPLEDKGQALKDENIKTFHLKERYQEHKDYAYELVKKSWYYSPSYIAALYDTYAGTLFSSEEEIKRLAIGNYYQEEDMGKRPLSKLTRDIAKQFGLY